MVNDERNPLLDPDVPERLRRMAAEFDELVSRTRALAEALPPPPLGVPLSVAHAYATGLQERAAAFIAWVDSPGFPVVATGQRDRFRTVAARLVTCGRRLGAATERRRVDELIERAGEAMRQSGVLLAKANAAVMRHPQVEVDPLMGRGWRSVGPA